MSNQIERIGGNIGELGEDKIWRTTCACMGEDNLTFQVCCDDEYPDVYLEAWMDCSSSYIDTWSKPKWLRPFHAFGRRVTAAITFFVKGHVKVSGSFIFRGEDQIDELCNVLQNEKYRMKSIQKRIERKKEKRKNDKPI